MADDDNGTGGAQAVAWNAVVKEMASRGMITGPNDPALQGPLGEAINVSIQSNRTAIGDIIKADPTLVNLSGRDNLSPNLIDANRANLQAAGAKIANLIDLNAIVAAPEAVIKSRESWLDKIGSAISTFITGLGSTDLPPEPVERATSSVAATLSSSPVDYRLPPQPYMKEMLNSYAAVFNADGKGKARAQMLSDAMKRDTQHAAYNGDMKMGDVVMTPIVNKEGTFLATEIYISRELHEKHPEMFAGIKGIPAKGPLNIYINGSPDMLVPAHAHGNNTPELIGDDGRKVDASAPEMYMFNRAGYGSMSTERMPKEPDATVIFANDKTMNVGDGKFYSRGGNNIVAIDGAVVGNKIPKATGPDKTKEVDAKLVKAVDDYRRSKQQPKANADDVEHAPSPGAHLPAVNGQGTQRSDSR